MAVFEFLATANELTTLEIFLFLFVGIRLLYQAINLRFKGYFITGNLFFLIAISTLFYTFIGIFI